MLRILFLLATVAIPRACSEGGQCCSPGQMVHQEPGGTYKCWDPLTNITSITPLTCMNNSKIYPDKMLKYEVDSDDRLIITRPNKEVIKEPGMFCLGTHAPKRNVSAANRAVILCYEEDVDLIPRDVYGFLSIVSSVFFLLTALIYALLPPLRDVQGKSIISFCLSAGIAMTIVATMKLKTHNYHPKMLASTGFMAYFFLMTCFFWMNALSIQVLLSIRRPSTLNYGWKEFVYYATYAWGCPLLLTIIVVIINYMPGDHRRPGIGLNSTWFTSDGKQEWIYMYSVWTVMIVLNILIFLYVIYYLYRNSFSSSHVKALRFKFMMTLRLFIVMGVTWIFEMMASKLPSNLFWEIMALVNTMQGVLVFLVLVVFRRRVVKTMHKHGWLDWCSGPVERYLAVGEDEEDVVQHTMGLTMDETKVNGQ